MKKTRLIADFALDHTGGLGVCIKHNDDDGKFQNHTGTNLGYDMICGSVNSDQEGKEGDLLNGNRSINLKNYITNIDNVLVCKECAHERDIQIKLEDKRDVKTFVDYVNLIRSGPGVFCQWGVEMRFPLIQTIDRFSVILYQPLVLIGCCLSTGS